MATRVAINGFGRIGRQVFKAISEAYEDDLEIVAINDLDDNAILAHLLKYDSTYGIYDADIQADGDSISVDGRSFKAFEERDPEKLPWGDLGVDIVVESTGVFRDAEGAGKHIKAGAKKVVITAPAKGEDVTLVLGVNEDQYDPDKHHIISNASCTTNCLAPVAKVIHQYFGIDNALMTTVHAYTSDQRLLDNTHRDLRRARSAAENIIPTTTGAARAVALVMPELKGKFDGFALRVPTPSVSLVDLVVNLESPASVEAINAAFKEEAEGPLAGILAYSEEPLVSSDYLQDPHSSTVDALSTMMSGDRMAKVVAWYDNEWGYSCRVADLVAMIAEMGV
ncbi:MAG TPA: type I glyceraldehyde-3-phosphate dehydrogenase [Thermomicrobiales bacterium]|nr:type I glyceraldehyde-3-phosphate dehydrogenase [Thermomicrobiales bacterium]